jgi:hypothetical protein
VAQIQFKTKRQKIACCLNTGTVFVDHRERFHDNVLETQRTLTFTSVQWFQCVVASLTEHSNKVALCQFLYLHC